MYCVDNGRPNRAVQTVLGVHLLKEMFNLTDDEALEQLEFNLLWHHALRLDIEETHLPQKRATLPHNLLPQSASSSKSPPGRKSDSTSSLNSWNCTSRLHFTGDNHPFLPVIVADHQVRPGETPRAFCI